MKQIVGNIEIEKAIIKTIIDTKKLVNVNFIAKKLDISWVTARAILYDMTLQQKLKLVETTSNSQCFTLAED